MSPDSSGAIERIGREEALGRLPEVTGRMENVLNRVSPHLSLDPGAPVLDVGAAQGLYVGVLRKMGYDAHGVEPWDEAVDLSRGVAEEMGVEPAVVQGYAEDLPFEDETFDLVLAISVFEHVVDPDKVMAEAFRVLRPGGGYYLSTIQSLCPRQPEIRRVPFFSWYPRRLKRRVMDWAKEKHPQLIGHTSMPAYNWYTPAQMSRLAKGHGFNKTFDRWDLKLDSEASGLKLTGLHTAQRLPPVKFAADVAIQGLALLAVK